ncbi:MAG: hypothetical protein ACRDQ5_08470 [Sciscionella sp.]
MDGRMAESYCSWCGKLAGATGHERCERRLGSIDPPRYCSECARRMVVQVSPAGWTAWCSRHGARSSDGAGVAEPAEPAEPVLPRSEDGDAG